jgi:mRNA deadenylase 3'-5' endonuclease subunit Ccr4
VSEPEAVEEAVEGEPEGASPDPDVPAPEAQPASVTLSNSHGLALAVGSSELNHPLGILTSAFSDVDVEFTNLTPNFTGVIDFVFFQEGPACRLRKLLELPRQAPEGAFLPGRYWPSDHLLLMCELGLRPPPKT